LRPVIIPRINVAMTIPQVMDRAAPVLPYRLVRTARHPTHMTAPMARLAAGSGGRRAVSAISPRKDSKASDTYDRPDGEAHGGHRGPPPSEPPLAEDDVA